MKKVNAVFYRLVGLLMFLLSIAILILLLIGGGGPGVVILFGFFAVMGIAMILFTF